MFGKLFAPVLDKVAGIVSEFVTDKDLAARINGELATQMMAMDTIAMERQAAVIIAEAQGESWLQRNWRPLGMLTFIALIVARWVGLTIDIAPEIEVELLGIVKIGFGGYVVGRSGEKIAKTVATYMGQNNAKN